MRHPSEVEWEEKYGNMSEQERDALVRKSLSERLSAMRENMLEEKVELSYPEIVKAIPEVLSKINALKDKPEQMREAMIAKLNKEFDKEVKFGRWLESSRFKYVNTKVCAYMGTEEYLSVKEELAHASKEYAQLLSDKENWERENADIIEAERVRTKRAELLSADPETLKALGITPDPSFVSTAIQHPNLSDEEKENLDALRSIHPYATDAELRGMLRDM